MNYTDLDAAMADAMNAGDWAVAEALGDDADRRPALPAPDLLTAALWYASIGLRVFPLQPNSKIPYPRSNGCKDGTNDPDQVTAWWTTAPSSNIGIATGHLVDVIDLDGLAGILSLPGMTGLPPVIGRARTVRPGGWHLYIPATGIGNRAGVLPGIDIRGDGGYVVAPPSRIDEAKYRRASMIDDYRYRWVEQLQVPTAVAA